MISRHNVSFNIISTSGYGNFRIPYSSTNLIRSLTSNNIPELKKIIGEISASKNAQLDLSDNIDSIGICAVYWALEKSNLEVIKILIKHRVNFDITYRHNGETPTMHAIKLGRKDVVLVLIQSGVNLINALSTAVAMTPTAKAVEILTMILNEICYRAYNIYLRQRHNDFLVLKKIAFSIAKIKARPNKTICDKLRILFFAEQEKNKDNAANLLENELIQCHSILSETFGKKLGIPLEVTGIIFEYSSGTLLPYYQYINLKYEIEEVNNKVVPKKIKPAP